MTPRAGRAALAGAVLFVVAGCAPSSVSLTDSSAASDPARPVVVRTSESVGSRAPSVTAPPAGERRALDVLATIPVAKEHHLGYERDRFGYPADLDGDGCDTRAEVLISESLTPAQVDPSGCGVVAGDWYSAYDDETHSDPGEVQIDHLVALSEAWDSGAWDWSPARLVAYGNDLDDDRTLRAVTGSANEAKGNNDPSNWIPPNPAFVCPFLADWIAVKARWGLSMDQSEFGRIRNLLTKRCPDQTVAPWPAAPEADAAGSPAEPATSAPSLSSTVAVLSTVAFMAPGGGACDPAYPTVCIAPSPPDLDCKDVPYRRFEVLAPDPHRFDSDHDGIGCER